MLSAQAPRSTWPLAVPRAFVDSAHDAAAAAAAGKPDSAWLTLVSPGQELCMVNREKAAAKSPKIAAAVAKGESNLDIPDIGPVGQTCLVGYTDGTLSVSQCMDRLKVATADELGMFASACNEIGYNRCMIAALIELSRRGQLKTFISSDVCKKLGTRLRGDTPSDSDFEEDGL